MNERIRQLADQAEFSEKDLHIQGDNFQKFAELIVRECTSVVDNLEGSDYIPWVNAAIKKHFGVE